MHIRLELNATMETLLACIAIFVFLTLLGNTGNITNTISKHAVDLAPRSLGRYTDTPSLSNLADQTFWPPTISIGEREFHAYQYETGLSALPCPINISGELGRHVTIADVERNFSVRYELRSQLYNPGLVCFGSKLWMIGRHEGRNRSGGWVECPENSLTGPLVPCPVTTLRMISFVVRLPLTPELLPAGPIESVPYNDFQWKSFSINQHERQIGPEDPRMMHINSDVWIATNGPPSRQLSNPRTIRCMKVQRIFPIFGPVIDLDIVGRLQRIEKNWCPIVHDHQNFLFSRRVEPHEVVSCSTVNGTCTSLANSSSNEFFAKFKESWKVKDIHLGTNAVRLPTGKYMAIFHGISAVSSRAYMNFVYIFDGNPPWRIVGVGAEPLKLPYGPVTSGAFVFTTNVLLVNATQAIISYTVKDRTASFLSIAVADMLRNMHEVPVTWN